MGANSGLDITYYGFKWGTSNSSLSNKTGEEYSNYKGYITGDLSGLSPGTTYYFQALAQKSAGASYGQIKSFTTNLSEPSVLITKPSVTTYSADVRGSTAALNGYVSSDEELTNFGTQTAHAFLDNFLQSP